MSELRCVNCHQPVEVDAAGLVDHVATKSRWCDPDNPRDPRDATLPAEPAAGRPVRSPGDGGDAA